MRKRRIAPKIEHTIAIPSIVIAMHNKESNKQPISWTTAETKLKITTKGANNSFKKFLIVVLPPLLV